MLRKTTSISGMDQLFCCAVFPSSCLGRCCIARFRGAPAGMGIRRDATVFGILLIVLALLHFGASDLLVTFLFALIILASVRNAGRYAEWANMRALVWLGDASYSIYLIHSFIQCLAMKLLARFGMHNLADLSPYSSLAVHGADAHPLPGRRALDISASRSPRDVTVMRDILSGKPSPKSKGVGRGSDSNRVATPICTAG